MALKLFLIFMTVLAYVEFLEASPTRRQYIAITEATASDMPVTNDGAVWDDNDEFDLDGEGWFSRSAISPSPVPDVMKAREMSADYADDYSRVNAMAGFGEDDDEDEDDEEEDHHEQQEAEEEMDEDGDGNDSEFLFSSSPKDTRLMLEDDDDDEHSGPIKVRHTGRNSYSHSSSEGSENSVESSDEEDEEHPDDFAIDEDDNKADEDDDEDRADEENSVEVLPRREPLADDDEGGEDEFVSDGDENDDMFENPEEEAAQVIYGDHVFLY